MKKIHTHTSKMKLILVLSCVAALAASVPITEMDQFIEELNMNIPNNQWVAGKNFESLDQVLPLLGALPDQRDKDDRTYREGHLEAIQNFQAADSFDSRTEWSDCKSIGTIWDQANCGSCWAVAAAGAISDRICIHKGEQVMVSAEQLMDCCWMCGFGCNGGQLYPAWNFWKHTGLVSGGGNGRTDTCMPYSLPKCDHHVKGPYGPCPDSVPTPRCKSHCTNEDYDKSFNEDKHHAKSVYDVRSNEAAIMEEVQKNGPVEVAFTVYSDFPNYKSGVYQHTSGRVLGGHAVRLIGWGEERGVKYWLIANSWNKYWGDNGTFKIKRGVNECGIESNVVGGLPA